MLPPDERHEVVPEDDWIFVGASRGLRAAALRGARDASKYVVA